jgi:uncharacterized membrane protein
MAEKNLPSSPAILTQPEHVFITLVIVVCGAIWLFSQPRLGKIAKILPIPIWVYIVPMLMTSFGILSASSAAYDSIAKLLVPVSLFLLTVSSDFRSTFRIGPIATLMLAAGTSGVLIGGVLAYLATGTALNEDAWKGFAVLAASWTGGSANAVAVQQGLNADPGIIGPLLIVDSLLGYGWVALLLFLSGQKHRLNKLFRYVPEKGFDIESVFVEATPKLPMSSAGLARVLGAALVASAIAMTAGGLLPEIGNPTIFSATTWTILITVALGVLASFSRLRTLESDGASDIGYILILLLLASLGARGDLGAFLDAPVYIVAGIIWLVTHMAILAIVAWTMRAPAALFALGSVANIGGFVTAPIIATAYSRNLVPTALLMAALAQIAGVYLPFVFAAFLSSLGSE